MKMKIGGPRKVSTSGTRSQLEDKPRKKKKKVDTTDLDDTPVKKKKKKSKDGELTKDQSYAIATVGGSQLLDNKLDKQSKKALKSYFGKHSLTIMEMLEAGDSDNGILLLQKKLLQTVIRVLPKAEEVLNESGTSKGTYQFVTLVSQLRELIADIQATKDRAYIAQSLLETIIRPAFMSVAQDMMTKHHTFRKLSEDYIKPNHLAKFSESLLALAKDVANDMNVAYKDVDVKLTEALKT